MAHRFDVDDSDWKEVMFINGYAVFVGYLMMGVKGLGILILTWTTVVLLGGFVSILGKKDFWCLTGITLVQTAGVFNIVLEETVRDLVRSGWGLLGTAITIMGSLEDVADSFWHMILALFIPGIQALVLVIILCPVAVLYVLGIYICAGVGLWRLIQHDFDNNAEGAVTHLKPALQVLYSLAVAQGVLYGYRTIHAFGAKVRLAKRVAKEMFGQEEDLISVYLQDMVAGCEKDPSFATGRNFVTYSMDLLTNAKSNEGFIAGVKVLGGVIQDGVGTDSDGRLVLAKHLLTRPCSPFSQVIQRLLETLGPQSPYSRDIKVQAASIVALVANSISLKEHPEWIHYIVSLLDTFEEYTWRPTNYKRDSHLPKDYERDWLLEGYERFYLLHYCGKTRGSVVVSTTLGECTISYPLLVSQGFNILRKLAVHPENNRVIINTEGLLADIVTAPVRFKQLHSDRHGLWLNTTWEYSILVMQLAAILGETGTKVRQEISRSSEAIITTFESILGCLKCDVALKLINVEIIVLYLSVDEPSIMKVSGICGQVLNWILLLIFLLADYVIVPYYDKSIKISRDSSRLAGEMKISSNQERPLQQSVSYVLDDLTAALLSAGGDISTRVHAAKILVYLVSWYTKDDELLKELKTDMVSVMPEVLNEILGRGSTGEAVAKAANNVQSSLQHVADIETGGVSGRGEGCERTASSSQQQKGDEVEIIKQLHDELRHLCRQIYYTWYGEDAEVTRQLDEIAEKVSREQGKPVKSYKVLWLKYLFKRQQ